LSHIFAIAAAVLVLAPIGTADAAPKSKPEGKNLITVFGTQKFGKSGDVLREQVDCPPGWFAIDGGYLTSGVVVSTWKNFALRHPEGWVAEVYAPPAPPPLPPMDDVSLSVRVDCTKSGIPLVLPVDTVGHAPTPKPKPKRNFLTVLGPVKQGKSGDKLQEEVDCPKGFFALNGGYVAGGIIISTWENYPVRHPEGWVAEIYAPPNGPFGPAQDISLRVKVDCARSGVRVVLPIGTASRVTTLKPKKNFVTVYGTMDSGKSGDKRRQEVNCPKGYFALDGGSQTSGLVSTWESFPARHPDGWVAEIFAPPAGPYAPPQDVSLQVKVDCAKAGIPLVLPSG
jgi:hypothetical protein